MCHTHREFHTLSHCTIFVRVCIFEQRTTHLSIIVISMHSPISYRKFAFRLDKLNAKKQTAHIKCTPSHTYILVSPELMIRQLR